MWNAIYKSALVGLGLLALVGIAILYRKPLQERHVLMTRKGDLEKIVNDQRARLDALKLQQERLQTDPRFVEKLAREEFGYARPGEIVFKFEGDPTTRNR